MNPLRILVTGSRNWTDTATIQAALIDALARYSTVGNPVLVHGGARGADTIAEQVWSGIAFGLGGQIPFELEVHPADWERYGKRAGMVRNAEMVNRGARVCLAFPLGESRGTRGCMELARKAGIPVIEHSPRSEGAA